MDDSSVVQPDPDGKAHRVALWLGVMQPIARTSEHASEGVERSRPQAQGHGTNIDMHDLALGAVGDDVAVVGSEGLEGMSVAHRHTLQKLKTVFNIEIEKNF